MKRLIALLFLSCLVPIGILAQSIVVSSQADFDALDVRVRQLIIAGSKDILVQFSPGTYFFQEEHLNLMGIKQPGLSIRLEGNGARIVGAGREFVPSRSLRGWTAAFDGPFQPAHGFVDLDGGRLLEFRSEVRQARKRPEVVDRNTGLCRMFTRESSFSPKEADASWIILTQWFRSGCYKVEKIEDGYVYFRSPRVTTDGNAQTDVDAEYKYGKKLPRYVLYNQKSSRTPYVREGKLHLPVKMTLHECEASRFLTVSGSKLRCLTVKGFEFLGNGGGECLLKFYRSEVDELSVEDCIFDGIRGDAVVVQFTTDCSITGNEFRHIGRDGVQIGFEADRASIVGNKFSDVGVLMDNSACVRNQATGTRIADNVFEDFSYCAVASGIHYTESISQRCSSLIEGNEMYQTEAFRQMPTRILMDGGAIYLSTVSQGQVIRNNYIHDIGGPLDNRGIFLDDGAVNVEVYGNLVLSVANSYSIDSRRTRWVETQAGSKIDRVNVDNYIGENTVDGRVRFETRGGNDGCRRKPDKVLKSGYDRRRTVEEWRRTR